METTPKFFYGKKFTFLTLFVLALTLVSFVFQKLSFSSGSREQITQTPITLTPTPTEEIIEIDEESTLSGILTSTPSSSIVDY